MPDRRGIEDAAKTSGTVLPTLLNKSSRSSASLRGGSSRTDRSTSISLTGSPTKPGRSAGGSPTETVSVDCSVRGSLNAISCPQCACGAVYISLPRLSCVPFCHSATRHTFVSVKASAGLARERVVKAISAAAVQICDRRPKPATPPPFHPAAEPVADSPSSPGILLDV